MSLGRTVAMTDTGRKRRRNEDVFVVDPPIFAIADGMGGAKAGEVAAALAADALRDTGDGGSGEEAVVTLIQEANRRVYQRATEDAESHPQRSVITRVLGTDPEVDVDTITVEARSGDLFLLCSDGLYSMVGNERILELVERHRGDLDAAAKALVTAANKGGGEDNITVVAFEIAGAEDETLREPAVTAV